MELDKGIKRWQKHTDLAQAKQKEAEQKAQKLGAELQKVRREMEQANRKVSDKFVVFCTLGA